MNLEDWSAEMRRDVQEFTLGWALKAKQGGHFPDLFPLDLAPGDWDEQFHFWRVDKHETQHETERIELHTRTEHDPQTVRESDPQLCPAVAPKTNLEHHP